MPNYCENCLTVDGTPDTVKKILELVASEERVFDFQKIVPMPENIYQGAVGTKEKELYGKNNWYDWSIENWGTKWNSVDADIFNDEIVFLTAWGPCDPVITALAKIFPDARFTYSFCECGLCFCGKRVYENGAIVFSFDGDYAENPCCDQDDEWELSDTLFPLQEWGFNTVVQNLEECGHDCICGELHHREYEFGKIRRMADGQFVGSRNYVEKIMEQQVKPSPQAA